VVFSGNIGILPVWTDVHIANQSILSFQCHKALDVRLSIDGGGRMLMSMSMHEWLDRGSVV